MLVVVMHLLGEPVGDNQSLGTDSGPELFQYGVLRALHFAVEMRRSGGRNEIG
jgi:hypothetical protein